MKDADVLIIDDDQHVYQRVSQLLAGIVADVNWASTPQDGLRAAIMMQPDLILLDINMPIMDGLKVCRHLKEGESTRDIPILFLTIEKNVKSLARALDCGGADYILKPFNEIDLRARVRAALRTKRMIDLLKEQARIDALTGLSNRAALDEAVDSAMASHDRHGQPFALLMVDVDHFKQINDTHGHGIGDELLREVAKELRLSCRAYDTACRYGGDEFAIVLAQADVEPAVKVARRIVENIGRVSIRPAGLELGVGASGGLASTEQLEMGFSGADLIKAADEALYRAKRAGRGQLCVYGDEVS